jgi:hypothetical protein
MVQRSLRRVSDFPAGFSTGSRLFRTPCLVYPAIIAVREMPARPLFGPEYPALPGFRAHTVLRTKDFQQYILVCRNEMEDKTKRET